MLNIAVLTTPVVEDKPVEPGPATNGPCAPRLDEYKAKALKCLGQLPPFSPVLNRLLASLAHEDVSFVELAKLIEKDTVMSGNVLRMVNSAAYGRRGTINSISHGISVLGLNKLRNTVLSLSISRMWRSLKTPPGWSLARFNLHSVATAVLTDGLAQHANVFYPEGAFVSGLFHDFGKLLIATALPDQYTQIQRMHDESGESLVECETAVLGASHALISTWALEEWVLPQPIVRGVEFHHAPDENADRPETGALPISLSQLISTANESVNRQGMSTLASPTALEPRPDSFALEPFEIIGLGGRAERIHESFHRELDAIKAYF